MNKVLDKSEKAILDYKNREKRLETDKERLETKMDQFDSMSRELALYRSQNSATSAKLNALSDDNTELQQNMDQTVAEKEALRTELDKMRRLNKSYKEEVEKEKQECLGAKEEVAKVFGELDR